MTKRSKGQTSQHERVQVGCISGIINIFQFRQGRAIKRLLSDRKQTSNQTADEHSTVSPIPTEIFEHLLGTDASKKSVEELMEQVTFNENGSEHDLDIDIDEEKLVQAVKLFTQQKTSSDDNRCSEELLVEKPVNQNLFAKRKKSPRNIVILIPGLEQSRNLEPGIPDNNNSTKVQLNENFGWRSPNKNHFYTERFAVSSPNFKNGLSSPSFKNGLSSPSFKNGLSSPNFKNGLSSPSFKNSVSSPSFKNGEPVGKLKDDSEKSIYIEAKKHLSEMVKSGDKRTVSTNGNNPVKSLGRILSLPECMRLSPSQRMQNSDSQQCVSCSESKDNLIGDDKKYSLGIECFDEDTIVSEVESAVEEIEQTKELRILEEADITNGEDTEIEDSELAVDKIERPSPVSVLEPLLTDNDLTTSQSVEKEIQPHRIHFEEQPSSINDQGICTGISMEGEESTFEYVEAVLLGSDLNWDEFLLRWISASEILDQSLFEEVGLFSSKPLYDQKLLFDCANEAIKDVCEYYFGCFAIRHMSNSILSVPRGMDLINNVWGRVERYLFQSLQHHSPDQLVKKDFAGSEKWMNIRSDMEIIVLDMEEFIFGELVDELWSYT